jgi:transposase
MISSLEQAQTIIEQQALQNQELVKQLTSAHRKISMLQNQVEELLRRVYGPRSEKLHPDQLMLDPLIIEAINQPEISSTPLAEMRETVTPPPKKIKKAKRRHPGRIPIPEHLERREILLDVPEAEKVCPETGTPLKKIGEDVSEKLEYRPGKLIVNVYRRPKYAAPESMADSGPGVITAPLPDHPIDKCKADVGLLSHIIVSKFADHLPLYRQDGIFAREGVQIPRATQASWLMQIYSSIRPLQDVLKAAVLTGDVIFTDDTVIPLQVKGNGRVKKARLWVYLRGGPGPPLAVYDFSRDRSKKRPLDFLDGYQGYVHADAYSGYDELFGKDGIIEVGCWAHARRYVEKALSSRPREATDVLSRIAQLYHYVETPSAEMEPQERYLYRLQHAPPILEGLFDKMEELKANTIPSEPLRKAVDYALNQREALQRYLEDGRLRPDNNLAENAMRPVAIGRKNWLFTGSEQGGRAAALYLGLIESCKACGVNPWEYFDDMLRRIMSHPVNRLRELLPDQWKPLPKDEHGLIMASVRS